MKYFPDMCQMMFWVVALDEDVVQINDYRDVNHVSKDVIHEPLELASAFVSPLGITNHSKYT